MRKRNQVEEPTTDAPGSRYFPMLESYYNAGALMPPDVRKDFFTALADCYFTGKIPSDDEPFAAVFAVCLPTVEAAARSERIIKARRAAALARWDKPRDAMQKPCKVAMQKPCKTMPRIEEDRKEEDRKEENLVCAPGIRRASRVAHTENDSSSSAHRQIPSRAEVAEWARCKFNPVPPESFLDEFCRRMAEGDWRDGKGRDLAERCRWRRELSAWWSNEQKKNTGARGAHTDGTFVRQTENLVGLEDVTYDGK